MKVTLIGIDLAKNIFQVCGVNQAGKSVFNRSIKRAQLLTFLRTYPDATIAMEACSGSNYWGRELLSLGHDVKLIPPQHVKPFVKGNKNDRNDAFAICEAAQRPNLIFVQPRTLAQVDIIITHRIRERRIRIRTALTNQIRGLLKDRTSTTLSRLTANTETTEVPPPLEVAAGHLCSLRERGMDAEIASVESGTSV